MGLLEHGRALVPCSKRNIFTWPRRVANVRILPPVFRATFTKMTSKLTRIHRIPVLVIVPTKITISAILLLFALSNNSLTLTLMIRNQSTFTSQHLFHVLYSI